MGEIIYPELSYLISGILFSVHNEIGRYCNEKQVCDKIEHYLKQSNIAYEREKVLPISFLGEKAGRNRIDFLISDMVVLEIKTTRFLTKEHYYQIQRYLKALRLKLGILVNFRDERLKPRRILNSQSH